MANEIQRVIEPALRKLRSEKSRIDRQISALQTAVAAVRNISSDNAVAPRPRRRMSAEARRALATRVKAYWAKRRASAKRQTKKTSK